MLTDYGSVNPFVPPLLPGSDITPGRGFPRIMREIIPMFLNWVNTADLMSSTEDWCLRWKY